VLDALGVAVDRHRPPDRGDIADLVEPLADLDPVVGGRVESGERRGCRRTQW
jgi:hypothetical protein